MQDNLGIDIIIFSCFALLQLKIYSLFHGPVFLRAEVTLQVQHVQSWRGTALCQMWIPIEIPKENIVETNFSEAH